MPLFRRILNLFSRSKADREIDDELQAHIEMRSDDNVAQGMSPEAARRDAVLKFGNPIATKERVTGVDAALGIENIFRDVRYALRQLRKAPGFTAFTALTLTLGIGIATAMFAIVDGVLLRPLAFPHAQQLYQPSGIGAKEGELFGIHYADIRQWREATHNTADIAFSGVSLSILDTHEGAELISNVESSFNLLSVLGVQPMLGRSFLPEEQEAGNSHVIILSYGLWRQAFSADRKILGKIVHIGGVPYRVIGVMPRQFIFPLYENRAEVWTPLERGKLLHESVHDSYAQYNPVLRIKPDALPTTVQAQLSMAQAHFAQSAQPGEEVATRVRLTSLHDFVVSGVRPALTALEISVLLVWLIACSNVAGLLLARIAARKAEIAVRGALGAGKLRIVRQFLTESLLLSCAGALAGLGLAMSMLHLFRHMFQKSLPLSQNIHLNWPVFTSLIGFTLFTGAVVGVFPATIAANTPIEETLKQGGRNSSGDRSQSRVRNLLLISEIALAIVLLVGAGLMMRTMYALRHVQLGFLTDHIILTTLTVPNYTYKGSNLNTAAWEPVMERVRHLPGVKTAALSTIMPITHPVELLTIVYATGWTKGDVDAAVRAASPDLMHVLGIRMRAGRFFSGQDTAGSMPVAVVNQTFVNRYLGGQDALGKQIKFGRVPSKATIVGVLEDVHQDAVADPSRPELYLCMAQLNPNNSLYVPLIGIFMELAVRTQTSPGAMIPELRQAIHQQNPNLAVGNFTTMSQAVEDSLGSQRLAARVLGVFGGLALLITVVGLYGLLSYSVVQRTQEIGIRMALGADRAQVMRMVLRQAFAVLSIGIAIGLALAFWSSRLLHGFLYGTKQYDPWTLILVPAVLVVFGIVATFIPARRAASIDPMQALRSE